MTGDQRPGPDFDGKALGKQLLRLVRAGALATHDSDQGVPFASLVTVATDYDGSPLLLLSRLAVHTRHLERDPRASILLADIGKGDPLAHPRLTVIGTLERSDGEEVRRRFLGRHPKAKLYADFPDFSFWRMNVTGGHLNGGFARAASLTAGDLATHLAGAEALIGAEAEALAHLNDDHAEALSLYATQLAGAPAGPWTATGLDPEGLDLMAGDRTARLVFPERITGPRDLRVVLKSLADEARGRTLATKVEAAK
jgi:putative heme iron utilization protein